MSRSAIKPQLYAVRSMRRCRIAFSVHTGIAAPRAVAAAMAQIEIDRRAAAADATIKRLKAEAEIETASWKAQQWAEIERFKARVRAETSQLDNPDDPV